MNRKIRNELREAILEHLRPYLQNCARCHVGGNDDLIELNIWEGPDDISGRVVIRVGILDNVTQLHIPNVSFPSSWRGKGDGMRLIDTIYRVARKHRYALFVTQCNEGFYNYLLGTCGAVRTDDDSVEITEKTRLINNGRLAAQEFGDGYKSSYEAALEFDEMNVFGVDIKIVHGRVTPLAGKDQGKEIHHAWVEMGDLVIETSNGPEQRFTKNKFNTQLHAIIDHVYSVEEARAHVEKSGKFGPWN